MKVHFVSIIDIHSLLYNKKQVYSFCRNFSLSCRITFTSAGHFLKEKICDIPRMSCCWVEMSLSFWVQTCDDDSSQVSLEFIEFLPVMIWQFSSESEFFKPLPAMMWQSSNESEFLSPYLWWYDKSRWGVEFFEPLPGMMWQTSIESKFLSPYLWWYDSPRMSLSFWAPTCDDMTVLEGVWGCLSPYLWWYHSSRVSLEIIEPLHVMIWQFSSESGDFWAPTCDDMTVLEWVWVFKHLPVMMWQSSNESESRMSSSR